MSNPELPERPSLEYLKKLSKERLEHLRQVDPATKLAAAHLSIAREYGFPSWRALKAEIDRRIAPVTIPFFEACLQGDVTTLNDVLSKDPSLVHAEKHSAPHGGWTGLHAAAKAGRIDAVRLLLDRGADPNVREEGDNTYPLHWAAAERHIEIVRALLNAGGDVHGLGDLHQLDAIGWATYFHPAGATPGDRPEVAVLLVERGAQHHIFSAICLGDLKLIRDVVKRDPHALGRRMSRYEHSLTALHFAIVCRRYDILDLLIQLHPDLEAKDQNGLTALETAMLRGDHQATSRLLAAGAIKPVQVNNTVKQPNIADLANSVDACTPMIAVPDVEAALDWYASIGFQEIARYGDEGMVNFGIASFGKAKIMFNLHGEPGGRGVTLWLNTNKVDDLYQVLRSRQLEAVLGAQTEPVEFVESINDTFYGARQFGIRDRNGYILYFIHQRNT